MIQITHYTKQGYFEVNAPLSDAEKMRAFVDKLYPQADIGSLEDEMEKDTTIYVALKKEDINNRVWWQKKLGIGKSVKPKALIKFFRKKAIAFELIEDDSELQEEELDEEDIDEIFEGIDDEVLENY